MEKTHTLSVWVENKFGVLSKVSGLFASRGYNIQSLSVGETEDSTISRMTIVVKGDDRILEQVKKQLNKLIDTIKVLDFITEEPIGKELCFIKVNTKGKDRTEIITVAKSYDAVIADIGTRAMTIQFVDTTKRIDDFIKLLSPYSILEVARSGIIAISENEK